MAGGVVRRARLEVPGKDGPAGEGLVRSNKGAGVELGSNGGQGHGVEGASSGSEGH